MCFQADRGVFWSAGLYKENYYCTSMWFHPRVLGREEDWRQNHHLALALHLAFSVKVPTRSVKPFGSSGKENN